MGSGETAVGNGHDFLGWQHDRHARRTAAVLPLCTATTVLETVCGLLSGSMALLADGLHMRAGCRTGRAARAAGAGRGAGPGFRLWRLGPGHHGVVAGAQRAATACALLAPFPTFSHVTIEVEASAEPIA